MRLFSTLSFYFIALILLAGCSGNHRFKVIGDIKNMPQQRVRLQILGIDDKIEVVDSGHTDASGKFELSGESLQPGLYQLLFEKDAYILLSIDKGNVKVTGDWDQIENYNVSGSPGSASLQAFIRVVREHMRDVNTLGQVMDSLHAQHRDTLIASAQHDMQDIKQKLTSYIEQYADTTAFLPNALFAVRILNPAVEQDYMKVFLLSIAKRFPDAPQTKEFTARYEKMLKAHGNPQQAQEAPAQGATGAVVGAQAPEISLSTPDGKTVSLSSLKGKYVLVDFWASWCGPCRGENPNVVAAYNKFKNKNFTIFGVSLDGDKEHWVEAIKSDGLDWTQVSDLKKWESVAARDYNIESIPTNFLLDKDGKIIARDLRGPDLEAKLEEVLK